MDNVCPACLHHEKGLFEIREMYKDVLLSLVPDFVINFLCWKCYASLRRVNQFRKNILRSKQIFEKYTKEKINLLDIATKSNFVTSKVEIHSYPKIEEKSEINIEKYNENSSINDDKTNTLGESERKDKIDKEKIKVGVQRKKVLVKRKTRVKVANQYKCSECGLVFESRGKYEYHKQKHRGRAQCTQCSRTFASTAALATHTINAHTNTVKSKEYKYYCQPCNKFFMTNCSYRKHQRTSMKHVDVSTWKYSCTVCHKIFPKQSLADHHHSTVHLHRNMYKCGLCSKQYCSVRALRVHKRYKHERANAERNYVCEQCGTRFKTSQVLKYHQKTHERETNIQINKSS